MNPAIVPSAIAIPPIDGVGALLQRSGRGGTTAPTTGATRRTAAPIATAVAMAIRKVRAVITTALGWSRIYKLRGTGGLVAEHERPPAEYAVADCIQSVGFAGKEVFQCLELEAVDWIAGLGLDERQRNHPVEEEVIGVAAGPRELGRTQTLGIRQSFEDLEVSLGRRRVRSEEHTSELQSQSNLVCRRLLE